MLVLARVAGTVQQSGCEVHLEGISEGALRVLELWRAEAEAGVLILLEVLKLQQHGKEEQCQQQH
jgi:hypothetical protein